MKIVLVGAEFEENLAVRYLRGALEAAGHQVDTVVFNSKSDTETAARALAASGAPLAGLSMVFTYRAQEFATVAARARELGYAGHIVAGGHFAAFHAERLLSDVPGLDSIARGEGEEILCGLAARLDDPGAVPGLVWRSRDGRAVVNPPAVKPIDLDTLPWPPRKEPLDRYLGLGITNILSSRGCTHACAFCSIAAWHKQCGGPRFRVRDPDRVAEEMAWLYERGARIFNFHDDNFLLPRRDEMRARLAALRTGLARRRVGRIAFAIKARPDEVDEDLFTELKNMGLFRVFLGIEAGTAQSLRNLGRGQTVDDNARALQVVNRLDLHTCFNLLLLNPGSSLEDLAANVQFLRRHPRNPMNFCRTEIYAGTPLERQLAKTGRLRGDYWGWDYRITDPRAQLAFEIMTPVFQERNHGNRSLHERAMKVDYECQLLGHFFGAGLDLRQRAKRFVVRVNENTCGHLETILDAIARGVARGEPPKALVETMKRRVAQDDRRLLSESDLLLAEIHRGPRVSSALGPRVRQAVAAASIVAAVGLSCSGYNGRGLGGTHTTEKVAQPVPKPESPDSGSVVLRELFKDNTLHAIAEELPRDRAFSVTVRLEADGRILSAEIRSEIGKAERAKVERLIREQAFPGVPKGTYSLSFTAREVGLAQSATQIYEMVPEPSVAPEHYNEKAAAPPLRKDSKGTTAGEE